MQTPKYLMFTYNLVLSEKVRKFFPRKGYLNLKTHEYVTQEHFRQDDLVNGLSGPLGTYDDFFITALYPNRFSDLEKVKGKLQKYGIVYEDENDNPLLFIHRASLRMEN